MIASLPSPSSGVLDIGPLSLRAYGLCIALGAHPKAIQERLGHSSITVTIDTYGHLFPALDEALSEGLERTYQAARANRTEISCGADVVQIGS